VALGPNGLLRVIWFVRAFAPQPRRTGLSR
jgi:hypothetical protein